MSKIVKISNKWENLKDKMMETAKSIDFWTLLELKKEANEFAVLVTKIVLDLEVDMRMKMKEEEDEQEK